MNDDVLRASSAFAEALIQGRFQDAHRWLSSSAQQAISEDELRDEFLSLASYDGGVLTEFEVMPGLQEWPAKLPGDVSTSYIALTGQSARHVGAICEAVDLVLAYEGDVIKIRCLGWGRP